MVFLIIGIISLLYYGVLVLYAASAMSFSLFWLILALIMFLLAALWRIKRTRQLLKGLPLQAKTFIVTTLLLFLFIFCTIEALVISSMNDTADDDLDYIIVLGARVYGDEISDTLKYRLDTAYEYLIAHPDTVAIVTGAKNDGEDISEAAAMRTYLINLGIDGDRVLPERYAQDTEENIKYSIRMIDDAEDCTFGIVTSSFHVYRAVAIAEALGYDNVCGIAAPSVIILLPNMMVREAFAIFSDVLAGNI